MRGSGVTRRWRWRSVGIDLARSLIVDKLAGQARVISMRFSEESTAATIRDLADALVSMDSIDEIRQIEASAAALYWQAWVGRDDTVPRFTTKDLKRIPAHWTRFEGRRSVLSSGNGNRKAERPVNALLFYAYKLVEVEAILACTAVGLDPGLGLFHTDLRTVEDVELATLGWVHWFNNDRLHGYLGDVPPIEFEAAYAAQQTDQQMVGIQ